MSKQINSADYYIEHGLVVPPGEWIATFPITRKVVGTGRDKTFIKIPRPAPDHQEREG